jgi:murein DD-endopeptidase MepM/ murein hydrolase activator NlpD
MAGSSRAGFADYRTYYYKGKEIDKQVHLGQDLASVAQAGIIAENNGEVVWAEYLGIYGLCVIIDHGLGLQSLYAHMSQLEVQPGDVVARGQIIGRSGATGMAGGDHLHLGLFVAGVPVQPIEWWDAHWLRDNIESKLK